MPTSVVRAMVKHLKQVSFYKKSCVIITLSKVTSYIFKIKFLFVDSLTIALRAVVNNIQNKNN